MDGSMDSDDSPRQTAAQYYQSLEFPDTAILDQIRQYEKNFPEGGIYAPEFLGLPKDPADADDELAALRSRVRFQLIKKCLATICFNPDRYYNPQEGPYNDDNEVIQNAYESNGGTVANPIVIGDDDELSENGYNNENDAASITEGSEHDQQGNIPEEGAVHGSHHLEDPDDDSSSDSNASDHSLVSEYAEVHNNEASPEYDAHGVGGSGTDSTQSDNEDYIEDTSQYAYSKDIYPSIEVDDDESDDSDESDYSANARRKTVQPPAKTAKLPSKTVKSPPKTDQVSRPENKASNKKSMLAPPRLAHGDYFYGSTRLLALTMATTGTETNPQSSLGKRGRKSTTLKKSQRISYASDEDDWDPNPPTKKARVQRKPRTRKPLSQASDMNSHMQLSASLNEATSAPTQYSRETVSPEPRPSFGSKISTGTKRPADGKTGPGIRGLVSEDPLSGGKRRFGSKTLPGSHGAVGGTTAQECEVEASRAMKRLPGAKTLPASQPTSDTDESLVTENPPARKWPTTARQGGAANASRGKRSWDATEHSAIDKELRRLRDEEANNNLTGTLGLRDEKLWGHISRTLRERHNIHRSLAGCKYYWGRFGREKSGFDERVYKDPQKLSTSVQHKKR